MSQRSDANTVRNYLTVLGQGSSRTSQSADAITAKLESEGDPLKRLALRQSLLDFEAEPDWEADFVECAARYGEAHGLTRAAWRAEGVPLRVLKDAGI